MLLSCRMSVLGSFPLLPRAPEQLPVFSPFSPLNGGADKIPSWVLYNPIEAAWAYLAVQTLLRRLQINSVSVLCAQDHSELCAHSSGLSRALGCQRWPSRVLAKAVHLCFSTWALRASYPSSVTETSFQTLVGLGRGEEN